MKKVSPLFWVFIGLAVLAAGLVAYGVLFQGEAGLLPTVEAGGRWSKDKFPLKVEAISYRSDGVSDLTKDDRESLDWAITTLNDRLGFTAYTWNSQGEEAPIRVVVGVPYEDGFVDDGGTFQLTGAGLVFESCSISTTNVPTDEILGYVLQHELGHCIGLAHDHSKLSIMRRVQSSRGTGYPPQITDHDRKLIRGMYAP